MLYRKRIGASRRRGQRVEDFVAQRCDFIVIGGGTIGCIMASRLSERAAKQVLLIEVRL